MPWKADILVEKTYKDQCMDDDSRIFYTLNDDKRNQLHRVTKLVSTVVAHLKAKGLISEDELDDMLLSLLG